MGDQCTAEHWTTEGTSARLRDCFETTDWEALCSPHGSDIGSMTQHDSLQACCPGFSPDKDLGEDHPESPKTVGGHTAGPPAVCLPAWDWGG